MVYLHLREDSCTIVRHGNVAIGGDEDLVEAYMRSMSGTRVEGFGARTSRAKRRADDVRDRARSKNM